MNAPAAPAAAVPASSPEDVPDDVPDDMRWPADAAPVDLDAQLDAARSVYHAYIAANRDRISRDRGYGSLRPEVYAREKRVRLAMYHSLLALKRVLSNAQVHRGLCQSEAAAKTSGATPCWAEDGGK